MHIYTIMNACIYGQHYRTGSIYNYTMTWVGFHNQGFTLSVNPNNW